jgi:hypothetical protein
VSEVAEGKGLQELLEESPTFSCASVARIVRGCLRGVRYAHSKNVVFGSISTETIVIRADGEPKISGLTKFAVRNELAEAPAVATDDIDAVKEIAKSLVRAVAESDRGTESFSKLKVAVVSIGKDPKSAVAMLDELVRHGGDSPVDGNDIQLAPETPRAPVTSHPATAIAQPSADETPDEPVFEETNGFLTSLAKRNPVALIAASTLVALLLIGGTVFAASKLVVTPTADARMDTAASANEKKNLSRSESRKQGKRKKPAKVERPDFRNTRGALSDDAPIPKSVTDPNANLAAIDAIFNKDDNAKQDEPEVANKTPDATPSQGTPKQPENQPPVPVKVAKQIDPPRQVAASSPPKQPKPVEPKARKGKEKKNVKKQEPEYLAAGADPFEKFVTVVELPETSSSNQVSFGKLVLEKRHLLGAEILATPTIHRSKPVFEMARSSDDKQTWDISYRKKKKSQPVVVANLQKTANELKFNWLPDAANLEAANYLRNCRVKLSTPSHTHWLTLRKPFKIKDFMLGKKNGQVKVDFEIPYMPNPLALGASANGIKFERLEKEDYKQKAHLEPSEMTPGVPARMYFHKDKDRFLSLDVGISLRKKITLQAALVMQPEDQAPVLLEDPSAIAQVGMQIRQAAKQAQQLAKQAEQAHDRKEIKWDEEKAYVDAAKKATDQAEHTKYYEHVVPQLVEKEIPVTITYALDDQHRIILAYTAETAETKKK